MNIVIIGAAGGIGSALSNHFSENHNIFWVPEMKSNYQT